jgi:hypothetical protein
MPSVTPHETVNSMQWASGGAGSDARRLRGYQERPCSAVAKPLPMP